MLSNWGGPYSAIVGVSDITDDGRPDLVLRNTSGKVWRNSVDGKGWFVLRAHVASDWSDYKVLS